MKYLTKLVEEINEIIDLNEKIEAINKVKEELHKISPFRKEAVDCVVWVKAEEVCANDYNPNKVAAPEMKLLHTSIKADGFTQPIVTCNTEDKKEVIDGFHRNRVGKEYPDIKNRVYGYLPIVTLDKAREERIAATIRHNRARGTHQIRSMSEIVLELTKYGETDKEICEKLGMELDEVIRLKQITGLKEAFQNHEFSKSWEEFESKYYENGKV